MKPKKGDIYLYNKTDYYIIGNVNGSTYENIWLVDGNGICDTFDWFYPEDEFITDIFREEE